jgi:hypothetical protein
MRDLQSRIKIMPHTVEQKTFSVLGQARKKEYRVDLAGTQMFP